MAISNEATIRVRIDGKEAEVSVKDLGQAIQTVMKKAKAEADKVKSSFDKIGDFSQKLWFGIQNLKMIGRTIGDMSMLALKAQDVKKAFVEIAPPGLLNNLREAVKGTVDDFSLMKKTVEAVDLGATNEQIEIFAKFARLEAVRKGGDTMTKFGEIISGVLRGSTELLDNFGINLTDLNRKIGELAGGKALNAVERRAISVDAAVALMNERLQKNGDIAKTDTERMQQWSVTLQNFKLIGGTLLNTFLIPLSDILRPIADYIQNADMGTVKFIGTIGLAIAVGYKMITMIKALGFAINLSMGPIGWILGAISLLVIAYTSNFLGIQDGLKYSWQVMVAFFNSTKTWMQKTGELFKLLGELIYYTLSRQFDKIGVAWAMFIAGLGAELGVNFKAEVEKQAPAFQAAGVSAGKEFGESAKKELGKQMLDMADDVVKAYGKLWLKLKYDAKNIVPLIEKLPEQAENLKEAIEEQETAWDDFKNWLYDGQEAASNAFATIKNGLTSLSARIAQSVFNTKTQFKDLWQAIAQDFLSLFINEILKQIVMLLIPKFLSLLALFDKAQNDQMAVRIGRDFAGFFTQGVLSGLNPNLLAGAMAGGFSDQNIVGAINSTNRRLGQIETLLATQKPAAVNVSLEGRQLYSALANEKKKYNIRAGNDVNKRVW